MRMGRSIHALGSPDLSWLELRALLRHAPADACWRAIDNPMAEYTTPQMLLTTLAVDALLGANWQRGGSKGPRPEPIRTTIASAYAKAARATREPTSLEQMGQVRQLIAQRRRALAGADR